MTKRKINVMVLTGGASSERSVSLASGQQIVQNLDPKLFNVLPAVISKDGKHWNFLPVSKFLKPLDIFSNKDEKALVTTNDELEMGNLSGQEIDIVFIAMHGPGGEDGKIQGLLELLNLKYTGSGVLASAIGMDKFMFRKLMKSADIVVPKYIAISRSDDLEIIQKTIGKLPYFVKPTDQGSSVGMAIVKNKADLKKAVSAAFKYSDSVLVDEYIKGREFTCAVVGNTELNALPIIEIIPKKAEFFDFNSKYSNGGADEIVPAKISIELSKKLQEIAIKVYKIVGCKGFGRVDFIVTKSRIYVLEINTIPGLTSASLMPKAAKAAGISYPKLLEKVIDLGLE